MRRLAEGTILQTYRFILWSHDGTLHPYGQGNTVAGMNPPMLKANGGGMSMYNLRRGSTFFPDSLSSVRGENDGWACIPGRISLARGVWHAGEFPARDGPSLFVGPSASGWVIFTAVMCPRSLSKLPKEVLYYIVGRYQSNGRKKTQLWLLLLPHNAGPLDNTHTCRASVNRFHLFLYFVFVIFFVEKKKDFQK